MPTGRPWSGISRRLTLLFLVVLVPPAVTLVWLGKQLLDQDRTLWAQRELEHRQTAADAVARSLEKSLLEAQRAPVASPIPEGALRVVVSSTRVQTNPPGRALWQAVPLPLPGGDSREFVDAEALEFRGAAQRALIRYEELAQSRQPSVRAGALLRVARVYRSSGQILAALRAYRNLAAVAGVAINNIPAELQARRAVCALLEESDRRDYLARESASLESDFLAGRWILDRADWELTARQIVHWTGHALPVSSERKALSESADRLWDESARLEPSGRKVIAVEDTPVTLLWQTVASEINAVAIAPSLLQAWAKSAADGIGGHVSLITDSGQVLTSGKPASGSSAVRRSAAETGLPWTIVVGPGDLSLQSQDLAARRLRSLGLSAIVLFLAGGSYLLWRVVQRELAVARLQTDFVSAVSHEFRTPLTSLRHLTELLEEDDHLSPERRQTFYAALGRSTERLHRLVESLLDFGRMEAGRRPYRFDRADAGEITREVTEEFRREAAGAGFAIRCRLDSVANPVAADREALSRAVWNLLDNAVKYSGASREIEVEVTRRNDLVLIGVRDHGIGIPSPELPRIFQKFVRGAAANSGGIKGTGLGLAIVRHIVDAHGGTVAVTSADGEGSTFTIALPAED